MSTPQRTEGIPTRILVVDDEPDVAHVVTAILTSAGHEVVTASSGSEALRALASRSFDAIVSDVQMPGMSGLDLLRAVREHDQDVPVVLLTGHPSVETAAKAVEFGALLYLAKPMAADKLKAAVDKAVRLHALARAKRDALREIHGGGLEPGDRTGLTLGFERALASLRMAMQPIVHAARREVFGYEALLRSSEPTLPHPPAVLAAGERLGRLPDLGRAVRASVAAAAAGAPEGSVLFVNLHPRDLLDPELRDPRAPLSALAPRVVLEITERARLDDLGDLRPVVAGLRDMGYRLALDDLGAGYAGLTSLVMLQPEFVKLDMSLVRGAPTSEARRKIIGSVTGVARDLGMRIVAEGIETVEERDTVAGLGCELLQGYLFARPAHEFATPSWPDSP